MSETLTIEIQDKPGSAGGGPPRAPSGPASYSAPGTGGGGRPGLQPAITPAVAPRAGGDAIGEIAGHLGLGEVYGAFRKLFELRAPPSAPLGPAVSKPVTSSAPTPPSAPLGPAVSKPVTSSAPTPPSVPAAIAPKAPTPPSGPVQAPASSATGGAAQAPEAAGALEGLASAAGPAALAIGAVKAVSDQLAKTFGSVRESIAGWGQTVNAVIDNDFGKALDTRMDSVEKSLSKIPITGEMMSAAFGAAVQPVRSFTDTIGAFNRRADELTAFSPNIAVAQQMSSIRGIFDDLKEAQEIGPDLARMVESQNNVSHELRELLLPIKKLLAEGTADLLEALEGLLRLIAEIAGGLQQWFKDHKEIAATVMDAVRALPGGGLLVFLDALRAIKQNTDPNKKPINPQIWLDSLYEAVLPPGDNDGRPAAAADPRPQIPIVNAFAGM